LPAIALMRERDTLGQADAPPKTVPTRAASARSIVPLSSLGDAGAATAIAIHTATISVAPTFTPPPNLRFFTSDCSPSTICPVEPESVERSLRHSMSALRRRSKLSLHQPPQFGQAVVSILTVEICRDSL
jgi:hypothetical protein